MKIFEITTNNQSWVILKNIDISFDTTYDEVIQLLQLLIQQKTPSRNRYWLPYIEQFEDRISQLLSESFPDNKDADIVDLKNKATKMQIQLTILKKQLVM